MESARLELFAGDFVGVALQRNLGKLGKESKNARGESSSGRENGGQFRSRKTSDFFEEEVKIGRRVGVAVSEGEFQRLQDVAEVAESLWAQKVGVGKFKMIHLKRSSLVLGDLGDKSLLVRGDGAGDERGESGTVENRVGWVRV